MLMLPDDLTQKFNDLLIRKSFPDNARVSYLKWLRFYWDFCHKYRHDPFDLGSLPLFLNKLQEKRQSEQQLKQAQDAVSLFYGIEFKPAAFVSEAISAKSLPADSPLPLS